MHLNKTKHFHIYSQDDCFESQHPSVNALEKFAKIAIYTNRNTKHGLKGGEQMAFTWHKITHHPFCYGLEQFHMSLPKCKHDNGHWQQNEPLKCIEGHGWDRAIDSCKCSGLSSSPLETFICIAHIQNTHWQWGKVLETGQNVLSWLHVCLNCSNFLNELGVKCLNEAWICSLY